jgi:hypothetical protein
MANNEKVPQIRPYNREQDDKLVRFTVGRSCVDSLAIANNKRMYTIRLFNACTT